MIFKQWIICVLGSSADRLRRHLRFGSDDRTEQFRFAVFGQHCSRR
jgi:hypothetical protein